MIIWQTVGFNLVGISGFFILLTYFLEIRSLCDVVVKLLAL